MVILIESVLEADHDIHVVEVTLEVILIVVIDIDCVCFHSHVAKVDKFAHSDM